ncbi:AbrB/MazE/SpoVT family DNA-binding domain-containing protein [Erysipelotrichia bacterium]
MTRVAKIFMNGQSQAVRLPKECRFEESEVLVKKIGDLVVLYPAGSAFDLFENSLEKFPDDFMTSRNQPAPTDREL